MKRHHGVLRHEELRIPLFQRQFHLFSKQKPRVRNPVPHLREILNRHIRNRIGIDLALILELGEHARPVRAVPVEQLDQTVQSSNPQFIPWPKNGTMA